MAQNEKIKHELEALRAENMRLKAELAETRACSAETVASEKTEMSRLINELQLQKVQLANVLRMTNIGTWSYDFKNDVLTPSEQLKTIWTPPRENIKEAFLKQLYPEDRERLLEAMKHPQKSSAFDFPCRVIGDDGITYYLICRCLIECDNNGKPLTAHGLTWNITDKKLRRKQTLQTENHLRLFFEKIGLGAWEFTAKTAEIHAVNSIRQFLGISNEDSLIKNKEMESRIHFEDLERVKQEFSKVLNEETAVFDCMFRMQRFSGEYVWVLARGVPVFDDKARVHKLIGSIEDISKSKRYNRVRERLSFMQDIADALPIPVYYKDLHGRYIGFNEAFKEFGRINNLVTPLIGYTVRDLHKLNDRESGIKLERDEKEFLKNPEKSFEKTYCINPVSGKKRFIINKKSILYDEENGKPRYLVGGIFDITAMKQTEERLQQATERLNATLDAMSESIMCFDRKLTLLWANRAARTALEGENKRFTGRKWYSIWSGADNLDSQDHPVYKVLNEGEDFSTGKIKTADGRIFEIRAYPLRSRGRKISGVLEMSMDITEHEAIKKRAEIHKEQLMLADKMKSLGVLISGVAHEVNNPNNSISINIALLQKMWLDLKPLFYRELTKSPDFKLGNIPGSKLERGIDDLLFGIKDGSKRIGRIIDSLKAYIRNVPGNDKKIFDINDAIDNVVFLLKNQIAKATCRFSVKRSAGRLPVKGDQQKIEQVIINVLQNSCQALTSSRQSIEIAALQPTPGQIAVKVSDSGSGIEKEDLNYITDPFFTTKRENGGTGLGLSISSSILDEHKGYFNFSSEPGQGTSVEIILPLADEAEVG